ncbi:hypothetical protein [Flavobacterium okayamense]|uniref:DUF4149 domain-containing protein n=1 Tax=Flavobacterium okayamense TaxID=2830782 RepID=A0ABN6I3X6_9FLAO|nr:hypothetical protein [Flavobacterium okayamense]BCY29153.1 hypothetical protein KK2020170_20210 [Flavobacterium okayamense]
METQKSRILFFGTAIFTWLTTASICYTLYMIVKDLMMIFNIDAALNIVISNFFYLIIFLILLYYSIKNLNKLSSKKTFFVLIISYFIIQILQFLYSYFFYEYMIENLGLSFSKYYDTVDNLFIKFQFENIIGIIKYLIAALLILYYSKETKLIS